MARLIIFIALLLSVTGSYAQTDSVYVWNKWCSRRDTLLLFAKANNMIQVYCRGMKPTDFKLKSLDKTLRIAPPEIKGDTMSVMAMPYPVADKKMRLAILNSKTSKVIKTVEFSCDNIPPLVATIGNLTGNEAFKKNLLMQQMMKASFPKSLYSYPYTIKQFTFKIQSAKGSAVFNVNGFFLTKDILQEINNAPVGTIAIFTGIKALCPDCALRSLDDLKIKIK